MLLCSVGTHSRKVGIDFLSLLFIQSISQSKSFINGITSLKNVLSVRRLHNKFYEKTMQLKKTQKPFKVIKKLKETILQLNTYRLT